MFVVAMVIAVLASVGLYALAAATTEVRMAGNERQSTQSHYLAEYGVLGAADVAGMFGDKIFTQMQTLPDVCVSLAAVPTTASPLARACRRLEGAVEFQNIWGGVTPGVKVADKYGGNYPYAPTFAPGSLGPTPLLADFFVELSEPSQQMAIGNSDQCAEVITVTSYGITQPQYPTVANSATGAFGGEGLEVHRARMKVGPINCRGTKGR